MAMVTKWENYGDVNPIEYGGTWVQPVEGADSNTEFYIVKLNNLNWSCGEPGFLVQDTLIDIEDFQDDLESVMNYISADEHTDNVVIAIGILEYFGAFNLGGTEKRLETEEEAIKEIESYGITL